MAPSLAPLNTPLHQGTKVHATVATPTTSDEGRTLMFLSVTLTWLMYD